MNDFFSFRTSSYPGNFYSQKTFYGFNIGLAIWRQIFEVLYLSYILFPAIKLNELNFTFSQFFEGCWHLSIKLFALALIMSSDFQFRNPWKYIKISHIQWSKTVNFMRKLYYIQIKPAASPWPPCCWAKSMVKSL